MSAHTYGSCPTDFTVGQRVALHPGLTLWARGVRYATVTSVGRKWVHVLTDHGQTTYFHPARLRGLDPADEFYSCAHCSFGSESEGAIARHYDTAHPDIEDEL